MDNPEKPTTNQTASNPEEHGDLDKKNGKKGLALRIGAGAAALIAGVTGWSLVSSNMTSADRPPVSASASPSPDNPSTKTPEKPSTKTPEKPSPTKPNKWIPKNGDILGGETLANMTEKEIRQACRIPANDPDVQTPLGLAQRLNYNLTSATNSGLSEEAIKPYVGDDDQFVPEEAKKFTEEQGKLMATCYEATLNYGRTTLDDTSLKFVLLINAYRYGELETNEDASNSEVLELTSTVIPSSVKYKDGKLTYQVIQGGNFDASYGAVMNRYRGDDKFFNYSPWPGLRGVTAYVSEDSKGNLVFSGYEESNLDKNK